MPTSNSQMIVMVTAILSAMLSMTLLISRLVQNRAPARAHVTATPATAAAPPAPVAGRGTLTIRTAPGGPVVTLSDLPGGTYPVEIAAAGYEPVTISAKVVANQVADLRESLTQRSTGVLDLTTNPRGAHFEVTAAGATAPLRTGETPQKLVDLPTGAYTVLLKRRGSPEHSRTVKVERGTVTSVDWMFNLGRLPVVNEPAGRQAGISLGSMPPPIAEYAATSVPANFLEEDQAILNTPSTWQTDRGAVEISSTPSGAEIFLGWQALGHTPLTVNLPAGSHKIVARLAKYPERRQVVAIAKGAKQKVAFTMRDRIAPRPAKRKKPEPTAWQKLGTSVRKVFKHQPPGGAAR